MWLEKFTSTERNESFEEKWDKIPKKDNLESMSKAIAVNKSKESKEHQHERLADLQEAASIVQKIIEFNADADPEARAERGMIAVENDNNSFRVSSWWKSTKFQFMDYDTISIQWASEANLTIDINPSDGLEEVIMIMNLINMADKKSLSTDELYVNWLTLRDPTVSINTGAKNTTMKEWRDLRWDKLKNTFLWKDQIDMNIVKISTLKNLQIDPNDFITYLEARNSVSD